MYQLKVSLLEVHQLTLPSKIISGSLFPGQTHQLHLMGKERKPCKFRHNLNSLVKMTKFQNVYIWWVLFNRIGVELWFNCFNFSDETGKNALFKESANQMAASTGCDQFELVVIAPDGTRIDSGNQRYEKQEQFRLITVDAAGFEVITCMQNLTIRKLQNVFVLYRAF